MTKTKSQKSLHIEENCLCLRKAVSNRVPAHQVLKTFPVKNPDQRGEFELAVLAADYRRNEKLCEVGERISSTRSAAALRRVLGGTRIL